MSAICTIDKIVTTLDSPHTCNVRCRQAHVSPHLLLNRPYKERERERALTEIHSCVQKNCRSIDKTMTDSASAAPFFF